MRWLATDEDFIKELDRLLGQEVFYGKPDYTEELKSFLYLYRDTVLEMLKKNMRNHE